MVPEIDSAILVGIGGPHAARIGHHAPLRASIHARLLLLRIDIPLLRPSEPSWVVPVLHRFLVGAFVIRSDLLATRGGRLFLVDFQTLSITAHFIISLLKETSVFVLLFGAQGRVLTMNE